MILIIGLIGWESNEEGACKKNLNSSLLEMLVIEALILEKTTEHEFPSASI